VLFVHRSLGVSAGIVALALLVGPSSLRAQESDQPDDPILSDAGAKAHR
jgi:hypothetical protein